jgi:hypothetical protein
MLDFDSRSTYLAAATDWKLIYADQSQTIRTTRRAFREAQAGYSRGQVSGSAVDALRYKLSGLRSEATAMIDDRHRSKVKAQQQYEQERQAGPRAPMPSPDPSPRPL